MRIMRFNPKKLVFIKDTNGADIFYLCAMSEIDEEWFRDWFNTGYYHLLYAHRDEKEAAEFLDRLLDYLKLEPGSRVLDLACGKGRHCFVLAEHGIQVTGIDLSEKSIEVASAEDVPGTEFYVHDMRLPFRINYYDAVLSLFSSFGYFLSERENRNALRSAVDAVKSGGYYVLDFMNVDKVIRELVPHEEKKIEGVLFNISRSVESGYIRKQIEISHRGNMRHYTESVRAYTKEDLEEMFSKAGLKPIATFGNYHLEPFNKLESDRLILVAQKSEA